MAIGTSGHRSRTSNTVGIRLLLAAQSAGIAMVKGVLVAKTTSPPNFVAFDIARAANRVKAAIRRGMPIWLAYGTVVQ